MFIGGYRFFSSSPGFACCFFIYTGGYWAGTLLLGALGRGGGLSISASCSSRKATRFDLLAGASVLVSSSRAGLSVVPPISCLLRLFFIQVEFGGGG